MTIGTAAAQQYCLGNGATTTFGFNFVWDNAAYIQVYYTAAGVQTLLAPSTYNLNVTPAIVGQQWGVGGTVTYPLIGSPIASGTSLLITRSLPYVQLTALSNQGNNFPVAIEQALDTLTMLVQQAVNRTGLYRGNWAAGVEYTVGDFITDGSAGANSQNIYMCIAANTSAVWTTDLAAGDWNLAFNVAGLSPTYGVAPAFTLMGNNTGTPGPATFSNSPTVGGTLTAAALTATGLVKGTQFQSTIATGTAPLVVASTTPVTNLSQDLAIARAYTAQQNTSAVALADGANIAWNLTTAQNAKVTLGGNRTLSAPSNLVDGGIYSLKVIQDATGNRTLAYNAVYKWFNGVAPTLQTAAGSVDVLTFYCDGTFMWACSPQQVAALNLSTPNLFTGQQNTQATALTDAANIAWNLNTAQVAKVTLGGNRTLSAPSNLVDGGCYILRVKQDGTGSRTLAYNAVFKFPGGVAPVLSTAANALDILTFVSDGTNMYGSIQKAFA